MDRQPSFAPVLMAPEETSKAEPASGAERIEIVLGNGRRLIIGAGIETTALARIVAVGARDRDHPDSPRISRARASGS